jgi:hypothetical protein
MNTIDKFLNIYSYKFPKGYPDLSSSDDINLINTILSELKIEDFDLNNRLKLISEVKNKFPKVNNKFLINEDLGNFKSGEYLTVVKLDIHDDEVHILFENENKVTDNFIFDINDKII